MKTTSSLRSLRKQQSRIDQSEASIYIAQADPLPTRPHVNQHRIARRSLRPQCHCAECLHNLRGIMFNEAAVVLTVELQCNFVDDPSSILNEVRHVGAGCFSGWGI
jgi:hypothetical protein